MSDAVAELEAMKKVAEALEGLESEARSRVLTWPARREPHGPTPFE